MDPIAKTLSLIAANWDVVTLVLDVIETGKLDRTTLVDVIKRAMTAASDAEMRREFPNG